MDTVEVTMGAAVVIGETEVGIDDDDDDDDVTADTGRVVTDTAMREVLITVLWAGQFTTVGPQLVTVMDLVE